MGFKSVAHPITKIIILIIGGENMNDIVPIEWNDNLLLELNLAAKSFRKWNNENNIHYSLETTIDNTMYHYTNSTGLKAIIENKKFWFTDYRFLNDPSEINYEMSLFSTNNVKSSIKLDTEIFKRIVKKIHMTHQLYNNSISGRIFISSYTEIRDDINQWKMYGDDGRGFVIKFSKKYCTIPEKRAKILNSIIYNGKVKYGKDQFNKHMYKILSKVISIYEYMLII